MQRYTSAISISKDYWTYIVVTVCRIWNLSVFIKIEEEREWGYDRELDGSPAGNHVKGLLTR